MSLKQKFENAILRLVERNQSYVNRKGVNAYSKEMDRLINDLINYYNMSQEADPFLDDAEQEYHIGKLQDEIERLENLLRIFNINPEQLKRFDRDFVRYKLETGLDPDVVPVISLAYFMELEMEYEVAVANIRAFVGFIKTYKRALDTKIDRLIEYYESGEFSYLKKYMRAVREYSDIPEGSIESWIARDYYNGSIAKSIDKTTESEREETQGE